MPSMKIPRSNQDQLSLRVKVAAGDPPSNLNGTDWPSRPKWTGVLGRILCANLRPVLLCRLPPPLLHRAHGSELFSDVVGEARRAEDAGADRHQRRKTPVQERPADVVSGLGGERLYIPNRKFRLLPSFTLEDSDPTAAASTTDVECISYTRCSLQASKKANRLLSSVVIGNFEYGQGNPNALQLP